MPSYRRREDMAPGDVYYSENYVGTTCFLVQVVDEDMEHVLENNFGTRLPTLTRGLDGMFETYRIYELVEEENAETE